MKHLTPQQFIGLLDGRLDPACRTHLEDCAPCRDEVSELRAITAAASSSADVPEPSPLFWQHFTARLQEAVAVEPVPSPSWWHGMWRPVAGIGVALACLALVVVVRLAGPSVAGIPLGQSLETQATSGAGESLDSSGVAMAQMAGKMSWEDLQRVVPTNSDGTADMLASLTADERAAFVRLLKSRPDGEE